MEPSKRGDTGSGECRRKPARGHSGSGTRASMGGFSLLFKCRNLKNEERLVSWPFPVCIEEAIIEDVRLGSENTPDPFIEKRRRFLWKDDSKIGRPEREQYFYVEGSSARGVPQRRQHGRQRHEEEVGSTR